MREFGHVYLVGGPNAALMILVGGGSENDEE
jgi:hypothetical protein